MDRPWIVHALVCATALATTLIPSENPLSRGLYVAVPLGCPISKRAGR